MKKSADMNKDIVLIINMIFILTIILLFFLRAIYNFDSILLFMSIFMFLCLFNYKPYLFVKYFFSIFYCAYMLIGLYICNNSDIYLYEIDKMAHYNGSFSLGIIYYIIFFIGLIIFDNVFSKKMKYYLSEKKFKKSDIIYKIIFIIGLIMFFFVFKNPSFKLNIDRFNYNKRFLPGWVSMLQSNVVYCVPLLLFPIITKGKKVTSKLILKIIMIILSIYFLILYQKHLWMIDNYIFLQH